MTNGKVMVTVNYAGGKRIAQNHVKLINEQKQLSYMEWLAK